MPKGLSGVWGCVLAGLLASLALGCKGDDPCRKAPECKAEGRCTTMEGACVGALEVHPSIQARGHWKEPWAAAAH